MTGLAHRWSARAAGAATAALLIVGSAAGTAFAAETDRTAVRADGYEPTFDVTAQYAVVATTHPDAEGCGGFEVIGTGTATGKPIDSGTWTQDEEACTVTVPGKYDIKGTATITESDGDELNVSYQLTAPMTGDTRVYPTGTFKITGGTGEYQFATGSGKMNAWVNLLDHDNVSCRLMGEIKYLG